MVIAALTSSHRVNFTDIFSPHFADHPMSFVELCIYRCNRYDYACNQLESI
jgi:hypothetical protein